MYFNLPKAKLSGTYQVLQIKCSLKLFSMILWQLAIKTCVLYKMARNLKALFKMDGI